MTADPIDAQKGRIVSKAEPLPPTVYSRVIGVSGILLSHVLAMLFVMMVLVKIVPTYAILFEQEEMALPAATQMVVFLSEFWVAYWYLLFFAGMFVDVTIVFILAFAISKTRLLSAYSHLVLLGACALIVYVLIWLSHPVYNLVL